MDNNIFEEVLETNKKLMELTKKAEYCFENNLPEYVKNLVEMTQTVYSYDRGLLLYITVNTSDVEKVTDFFDLKYDGYDDLINDYKSLSHIGIKYNKIKL